ncbi:hypothetical protein EV361DRAFT_954025 [Lentinula raphanica]|nr:hypothetical protein EV361DRAFT_954025 [Lentinula raphanica]
MLTGRRLALSDLLNPVGESPHLPSPNYSSSAAPTSPSLNGHLKRQLLHVGYKLNRKTTLSSVYEYPVGEIVEYPETGFEASGAIGHLFRMEASGEWISPARNFAYSRGSPRGKEKNPVQVSLLVNSATGEPVLCNSRHSTCQGIKPQLCEPR